ncbi:MAG: preprotein translocase subunit SecG [Mariniphaga sp.]|jgi:preprotein translocase subunit SecG|nr:preprotein translocase subunit SecG [Mariniphaga sp.]
MYTLITVLIFIVCVLLVLIVLVQNSKGGGLASNFQSSNQIMGVRKTTDFLEKATWVLAGALLVLSIMGSAFIPRDQMIQEQSRVQEQIETAVDPTQVPNFPTTVPETETGEEIPPMPSEEDNN